MELTYKTIRTGCIPPTVVISAPGLLVGSGMDTPLRGFLHAEPGVRDVMWRTVDLVVFPAPSPTTRPFLLLLYGMVGPRP